MNLKQLKFQNKEYISHNYDIYKRKHRLNQFYRNMICFIKSKKIMCFFYFDNHVCLFLFILTGPPLLIEQHLCKHSFYWRVYSRELYIIIFCFKPTKAWRHAKCWEISLKLVPECKMLQTSKGILKITFLLKATRKWKVLR